MANPSTQEGTAACTNRFGYLFILALEEILGKNGVFAVLNLAGLTEWIRKYPPDDAQPALVSGDFCRIGDALEGLYGVRGGRGLALRAGRASFKPFLRVYGAQLGLEEMEFRLLPLPQKLHKGITALAAMFQLSTLQEIWLEEDEQAFYWRSRGCPFCIKRKNTDALCHFWVGFLQEALYWLSGGKFYLVEETSCFAQGEPYDVFRIQKAALD
jgi:predicted hydrocarbon binding protein